MRPDRGIVRQAILDGAGNLSKTAVLLGCSRQTLYTWVYQLGLEKLAGVRLDTRDGLDKRMCKDTPVKKSFKTSVYSGGPDTSKLSLVATTVAAERDIPVTVKLPPALWKDAKIRAIRDGVLVSDVVREALVERLSGLQSASSSGKKDR